MGYQLTQLVIDMKGGLLTPAQKATLVVIGRYANDETGGNSYPTLETIAQRTEFNRRTVLDAVNRLIADGWITAVRSNYFRTFTVNVEKLKANQEVSDVQEVTHVQDDSHVQEITSDVQEVTPQMCRNLHTEKIKEKINKEIYAREEKITEEVAKKEEGESIPKTPFLKTKKESTKTDEVISTVKSSRTKENQAKESRPKLNWYGADQGAIDDFIAQRKAKHAVVTQRVIDKTKKDAEAIGWSLTQALDYTVQKGWAAFYPPKEFKKDDASIPFRANGKKPTMQDSYIDSEFGGNQSQGLLNLFADASKPEEKRHDA